MSASNKPTVGSNVDFDCDVLIVGAGPAGATAAYYIALSGLRVLLLDQRVFPRDKVCGDFVSPGSLKELQRMGITENSAFRETNVIDQAVIYLNGKELVSGAFPTVSDLPRYSRVVSRKLLDNLILDAARKAGAAVIEGIHVTDVQVENGGVTVVSEENKIARNFRARLVVGADGCNSLVARVLRGAAWPKADMAWVARGYFEGVTGFPNEANVFYGNDSFPGYSWLFPTGKGEANVGVGLVLGATPPAEQSKELLTNLVNTDAGMQSRLEHAKLKGEIEVCSLNLHDKQLPIVGDRVMLVGEAAGLINPYNGEGIQFALLSGRWAAETVTVCRGNFSKQALFAYSKRVDDELGYGFSVAALMLGLLRNRNLNHAWLRWIETMGIRSKEDPEYAHITSGILSGMIFPNQEATARILTGTLQEAALSVGLKSVSDLLKEPANFPQAAMNITEVGLQAVQYAAQNPLGALLWGMEAASKVTEIASSVSKQALQQYKKMEQKAADEPNASA